VQAIRQRQRLKPLAGNLNRGVTVMEGKILNRAVDQISALNRWFTAVGNKWGLAGFLAVIGCLFAGGVVFGQATITREGIPYPIPPGTANRMFFLQRTPNTNTIACDLNMGSNGEVNAKSPLTTYWLRYGDSPKGEKKQLNFVQRHFAYGLNIKQRGAGKYEFWFVSYKKYHMYLLQTKDGKWRVYGKINDKLTVLGSIFIYINGGTFWNPHVDYVELRGKDLSSGKEEVERLTDVKKDPDEGHNKEG
jgi:hypothetical protein